MNEFVLYQQLMSVIDCTLIKACEKNFQFAQSYNIIGAITEMGVVRGDMGADTMGTDTTHISP